VTGFIVRRTDNLRVWVGGFDGWSPFPGDARVFQFATIAEAYASRDCGLDVHEYEIVPVAVEAASAFWSAAA
jgi:hypothetical protein